MYLFVPPPLLRFLLLSIADALLCVCVWHTVWVWGNVLWVKKSIGRENNPHESVITCYRAKRKIRSFCAMTMDVFFHVTSIYEYIVTDDQISSQIGTYPVLLRTQNRWWRLEIGYEQRAFSCDLISFNFCFVLFFFLRPIESHHAIKLSHHIVNLRRSVG